MFLLKASAEALSEESRCVKVVDVRAVAAEPLMWAELTASQSAEMALGHTEFGTCQLPSLSGRVGPSQVGTRASSCDGEGGGQGGHESHFWTGVTREERRRGTELHSRSSTRSPGTSQRSDLTPELAPYQGFYQTHPKYILHFFCSWTMQQQHGAVDQHSVMSQRAQVLCLS